MNSRLFGLFLAVNALLFTPARAEVSLEPGNPAPGFFLYDLRGQEHFLSDYAGPPRGLQKKAPMRYPVLINFFGVNCKPCEEEIPYLARLSAMYQDEGLKVLLISKDPHFLIERYVKERPLPMTVLVDKYEQVNRKYLVSGIPVLYLIGPDGNILLRRFGFDQRDNLQLETVLRRLFKKPEVVPLHKPSASPKPRK